MNKALISLFTAGKTYFVNGPISSKYDSEEGRTWMCLKRNPRSVVFQSKLTGKKAYISVAIVPVEGTDEYEELIVLPRDSKAQLLGSKDLPID